jgi:macrolide transport system ATP-binding/permease protein
MIELKNISKTYRSGTTGVQACRDISLTVEEGEFLAIMGPSGSGKSTLLHLLGFLDRPDSGSYKISGREITSLNDDELAVLRNQLAGFVFQQFHLLPRITALENVELPLIYAGRRGMLKTAEEKINCVGLGPRKSHRPNQLSGGEQQRVAIARALVNEPQLIFADEPTGNLDTKSESEIVAILKQLNAQGKTIIMVTHEPDIAAHAGRIIRMRDGVIIADEKRSSPPSPDTAEEQKVSALCLAESKQGADKPRTNSIELLDYLRQSFQAIMSNKMRSFLSMLGITIGVAAVIAMSAVGEGARQSIAQMLSSLGSNTLVVAPGSSRVHGVAMEAGTVTRFTLQDADAIGKVTDVIGMSPSVRGGARLVYQGKNWATRLQGTGSQYAKIRASIPSVGSFFTETDVRARKKVAVLGMTPVRELFGAQDPIGKELKINRINFKIVGILPEKGSTGFMDQDDTIIIPVTTAMFRVLGKDYVDSIDIEAKEGAIEIVQKAITELVMRRHKLDNSESFQVRNMADIRAVMESMTKTMSMLLGVIAAISLIVGGIGIMNIMLVSVTERTREIGLRKAIGARKRDILTQFLIEAMVMTTSGGAIGLLLGSAIAGVISLLAGWATVVSFKSVFTAIFFSVMVGLVFGISPARQAAQLNPIEALRYE